MKHSLLLTVTVSILITSSLPAPAVAQRIGNGRILRRVFGLETEEDLAPEIKVEAKKPTPKPMKPVAVVPPTRPGTKRPTTVPRQPYSVSPSATRRPPNPLSPARPGQQLQPVPLPRPPQRQVASPHRSPIGPSSTPPRDYAKRNEPTPARRPMTMESPLPEKKTVEKKTVDHGQFGIQVRVIRDNVVISRVKKSSTAEAAGLKTGDIVKSIGEIPIEKPSDIQQLDDVLEPGDNVEFELVRKGKPEKMLVAFERDARPQAPTQEPIQLKLDNVDDDEPRPTLAIRPANPKTVADSDESNVNELQQIVESQQQIIEQLQQRLNRLEQATTTDAKPADKPLLLLN